MNRQQSGQVDGQANQFNMENSSDLELYEVNFQSNKLVKKVSSKASKYVEFEENNDEDIDGCINIYKKSKRTEEDDDEEQQLHHHQYQRYNNQEDHDDEDELNEVNGVNNNFKRSSQRYATQEYSEQSPQNHAEYQYQQNIGNIVREQIQQHNDELEYISSEYNNYQNDKLQNDQYNQINEIQEYRSQQEMAQQQHKRTSSQNQQSKNQQYDEHNEEPVRFEKQLSKMTPEEAEIEYQNRCQMQLQQLQQKQQSLKKSTEISQQTTQQTSTRQTYMIQSDKNSTQKRPSSGTLPKKQGISSQSHIQKSNNQVQRSQQQRNRDGNSIEQLQTVKSSQMISSQEAITQNKQQTQANLQKVSQINDTRNYESNHNSKNQATQNKFVNQQKSKLPQQTQYQRPQSSQPRRKEIQVEALSNIYYHGMQIKLEKEHKIKTIKQENEQREVEKCSFRPEITQKAQILSLDNNNYLPIEDKTEIHMKRKQILIEKRIEEKKKEEVQGCTFTPKINPKKYKSLLSDEKHNMSIYDRQIEWQKKIQDKNTERMKSSYVQIMTPSKKQESQTRNSSLQKKSNFNQQDNNPHYSITNSSQRLKQGEKGFFSEKRISGTFLTYLNCKYDYNQQKNSLDSSKNQEVPQALTVKPQEKDQIQMNYQFSEDQYDQNENVRIQKALEVCQKIGNNQQNENIQNSKNYPPHEYTFGHLNQLPATAHQQQQQQQQQPQNQPRIYQSSNQHKMHIVDSYTVNKSAHNLKYKKAPPASIDLIKQMVNKSLQEQFQSSKSISKSSSTAQISKQYSYLNTLPKKVNFSNVSKLSNVVVQNNQYTLNDANSQSELQEFYSVKQQLGNNYYQQFQVKSQQNQLKTIPQDAQFFSQRKQVGNNNHHALFEQAYKINREIKELHGSGSKKETIIQHQIQQEYGFEQNS